MSVLQMNGNIVTRRPASAPTCLDEIQTNYIEPSKSAIEVKLNGARRVRNPLVKLPLEELSQSSKTAGKTLGDRKVAVAIAQHWAVPIPSQLDEIQANSGQSDKPVESMVVAEFADGRRTDVKFGKLFRSLSQQTLDQALKDGNVADAIEKEHRCIVERLSGRELETDLPRLSQEENDTFMCWAPKFTYWKTNTNMSAPMLLRVLRMFPKVVGKIHDGTYLREVREQNRLAASSLPQMPSFMHSQLDDMYGLIAEDETTEI